MACLILCAVLLASAPALGMAEEKNVTIDDLVFGEEAMQLHLEDIVNTFTCEGITYQLEDKWFEFNTPLTLWGSKTRAVHELTVPQKILQEYADQPCVLGTVIIKPRVRTTLVIGDGNRLSGSFTLSDPIDLTDVYTEEITLPRDEKGNPVLIDRIYLYSFKENGETQHYAATLYVDYDGIVAAHRKAENVIAQTAVVEPPEETKTVETQTADVENPEEALPADQQTINEEPPQETQPADTKTADVETPEEALPAEQQNVNEEPREEAPPAEKKETGFWTYGIPIAVLVAAVCLFRLRKKPEKTEEPKKAEVSPADDLAELDAMAIAVRDETTGADLQRFVNLSVQIRKAVEDKPEKAVQARKFFGYYVPTIKRLVSYLVTTEQRSTQQDEMDKALKTVRYGLKMACTAADKQLANMYQREQMDADADIAVMENMLKMDGFTDEVSPFALDPEKNKKE